MSSLQETIRDALQGYFSKLDGESTVNIYQMVLSEVEAPLLEIVMEQSNGNQSLAARWLGLSRNTLRKLLAKYSIVGDSHDH